VPVRSELIAATLELQRRALRAFSKGMQDRRRHLTQLVRVLPRPESLFAQPRQRFDAAAEKLAGALRRNLAAHRAELLEAAAGLRPRMIESRFHLLRERLGALQDRAARAYGARHAAAAGALAALTRLLDSISYKAVLARGFALVRGEDGHLRRRAAALASGEALTLIFADGEAPATASGKADKPVKAKKSPADQGSLF